MKSEKMHPYTVHDCGCVDPCDFLECCECPFANCCDKADCPLPQFDPLNPLAWEGGEFLE